MHRREHPWKYKYLDRLGVPALMTLPENSRTPARAYLLSLGSDQSRRTMAVSLRLAAGLLLRQEHPSECDEATALDRFPWATLTVEHFEALRAELATRYSQSHANKTLTAVRRVVGRCVKRGDQVPAGGAISTEEASMIAQTGGVRGERRPAGRMISAEELSLMFQSASDGPVGARDRFGLALLIQCGLRRSEATSLEVRDVIRAVDGEYLRVTGKGNKTRDVPLNSAALVALDKWLSIRGTEPGPLLCAADRTGKKIMPRSAMTPGALYNAISRCAKRAGLVSEEDRPSVRPHDLRRTLVSTLLDRGVDLSAVSAIVGHASPDTTKRYDLRPARARAEAMEKLGLPSGE